MTKEEIINAWAKIREENNSIPDDVLDFMKDCAIERLKEVNQEQPEDITETEEYIQGWQDGIEYCDKGAQ